MLVTRPVVDYDGSRSPHLEFERIAEVKLKGFNEPTEIFMARQRGGAVMLEPVAAATGSAGAGRPVVVMYSGGRDSTCLLDIAVRIAGAAAVSALHVNYGLRAAADADERHCAELCERLGVQLDVRRPVRPEDGGNLQAWAREERYRAAAELALARDADVAAGHTALRPGRDDPLPARVLAEPAGAAGDAAARRRAGPPAAGVHARADGGLLPRARAALAR